MRIFDAIGIATVTIWLGIISLTAWNNFHTPPVVQTQSDQVVLTEGESWLLLTQDGADIGYVHESRTPIDDGWLLEYQTMISVYMLATEQSFRSIVKATVDEHAVLRTFSSELEVMDSTFRTAGVVDGDVLTITTRAGNSESTKKIPLTTPPRLLANAFNKIVARKDLKKGDMIEETFFDPTSMEMVDLTIEYSEPTHINIWDEDYDAHIFYQHTADTRLKIFAGTDGTVLIQVFPLKISGSRVPSAIGRAAAMTLRSNTQKRKKDQKSTSQPVDIDLETALKIVNKIMTPILRQ